MNKKVLRQAMRERKKQHSEEELQAMSQLVEMQLLDFIQQANCQTILLYHSLPDEVNTHHLIPMLYGMGKTVILPTVSGNELSLHVYEGEQSLDEGASFGIMESNGALFIEYDKIDIAFIPGMAFTASGDRLGRGKGYYDRLLPNLKCPLIGVAFPFQIVDSIPCESHDIRMTEVVCGCMSGCEQSGSVQ